MRLNAPLPLDGDLPASVVLRFCAKVRRERGGCWRWTGYTDRKGYGQMKVEGKARWAHRILHLLFRGGLPEGEHVHHICGNPSCVNPEHLMSLPAGENTAEGNRRRASLPDDIPV